MLFGGSARQFERPILERCPDVEVVMVDEREWADADRSAVDGVVGWRFPTGLFAQMPDLKWIQSIAVGVDDWLQDPAIRSDVVITNTKGLYDDEVAEYVIWAAMTLSRRFHAAMKNQQKRRWQQPDSEGLLGKTIGIAGMGHVGRATAIRARAMGMHVIGICRDPEDPNVAALVDKTVATADIDTVLGELDILTACIPVTDETRGLFDRERIARLKQGAIVINAAREAIFDYSFLLQAVRQNRLYGIALDVFETEPLRKRSPLWKTENVLITPHISALTSRYNAKVSSRICRNLEKLRSGQHLEGVVDRAKGY